MPKVYFTVLLFLIVLHNKSFSQQVNTLAIDSSNVKSNQDSVPSLHPVKVISHNESAKILKYESPKIKDAFRLKLPFISKDSIPEDNGGIFTLFKLKMDIHKILAVFGSKKSTSYIKYQRDYYYNEQAKYVDSRFNQQAILKYIDSSHIPLIEEYMSIYRPPYMDLMTMTDFELGNYIIKTFKEFLKSKNQ